MYKDAHEYGGLEFDVKNCLLSSSSIIFEERSQLNPELTDMVSLAN